MGERQEIARAHTLVQYKVYSSSRVALFLCIKFLDGHVSHSASEMTNISFFACFFISEF
ncbi:hypothetical protein JHK82_013607 [Glycine max]|uniref:Uncharacterized protein n=2 Tax=Glycine subgen. Soja TaxID=1462606 RepID=K7KRZ4_SOYBN|nr:hypothetical protein JHK87_013528 [Glycine soja]KAG5041504.1 hypothetical protein JHK85_013980 [Glycine max]KAG5058628.1 hypothetical protein JHK86_013624 [Glycine max]KAG5155638.1 hypothetical protein JHK82_013607 [Glycine max]KAH1135612.1 hypothetical protein GYH30_013376 [Glycine max]